MTFNIWNRRYTGSKYKLSNWIDSLITEHCTGSSFCDIFAGTGVIAASQLKNFDRIIINDFLYSNNCIYNAFFLNEKYRHDFLQNKIEEWLLLSVDKIPSNFIYENYGGKYFSYNDAKIIGYLREKIEEEKVNFNYKEYCILLASLVYSADKVANTVGHYDAYIKREKISDRFNFHFIQPYDTAKKTIEIYREDANILAKKINCDIVYIDPPYNSRQYSRFYHVLETIVKGTKPPLFGVALKPAAENMSIYCCSDAKKAFADLIDNLKCKYIIISYNNTYNSKSSSSRNKIELEYIIDCIKRKGTIQVFEKQHPFFNAGKTKFNDHKEYIFIVKVNSDDN